jgi:hypothetical protein
MAVRRRRAYYHTRNHDPDVADWDCLPFFGQGYYMSDLQAPKEVLEDLRIVGDKLVQLLIAKGAKEEEWSKTGDGQSEQVYPEKTIATPDKARQIDSK